jgi:hypothetical protein
MPILAILSATRFSHDSEIKEIPYDPTDEYATFSEE